MHTGWRFYIGDGRLKGGIRYNCMQQLIAPSATCDSNAKDRTKLQIKLVKIEKVLWKQCNIEQGKKIFIPI
ncbi:hypothetical protein T4A_5373 [Trichinella pseudospiralis]|uniref:Uncharacterized protein n=1 Tax=Trichinella pseudospiralis TaxID=6337 RepID=A0A0V1DUY1_TRIPS|nr:hypothetical protein T4A_5373 [Trichinella pseudospiralis]